MLANHACLLSAAYFLQFTLEAGELYMYGRVLAPVTSATSRSADRFNDTPAGSLPLTTLSADQQCLTLTLRVLLGDIADLLSAL